jgi:FtsP/CotA-like multicopper oxidase with cupredoxin domain
MKTMRAFVLAACAAAAAGASGQQPVVELTATGAQVYRCLPAADPPQRRQWSLVGPAADLFDANGHKVGRHYAGPTWELDDGSKVVGAVVKKEDGPDPTAIPWLVLQVKESSGSGRLAKVTSIRRVDTHGGKAPAGDCDPLREKDDLRVPYSATYRFYAG